MTEKNAVIDVLNKQVANWTVLYVKLHNYHWYVKGSHFFTLHMKFEELYDEASLHLDELAERILALKGNPVATMKECLNQSTLKEANGNETAEQMVSQLVKDFEALIGELVSGMEEAQAGNDETSADMLLQIHTSLEKHVWMLQSFLG